MALPPVTLEMLVVFGLILLALVLFVSELVPNDITAIGILVALVVLEPYTGVDATEAVSGFASRATLTIVAMYILSDGIQRTGLIRKLGSWLTAFADESESRLLGATLVITGTAAGVVNNTPVVAVFIPMITAVSERVHVSPSRLLLPLSYASMLGGTLTLIGTATNILASDLSAELLGHRFSMFEFTPLGIVVLLVGLAYLMTVGQWLTPERIHPHTDFVEEFGLSRHLARLRVREGSPLVGQSIRDALAGPPADEFDVDVLQVDRNGESLMASMTDSPLEAGDLLTVRANMRVVAQFADAFRLRHLSRARVRERLLSNTPHRGTLVEAVVPSDSRLCDRALTDARLRERFGTTVLAIRRGDDVIREDLAVQTIRAGDTLLLQTTDDAIDYLEDAGYLSITEGFANLEVAVDEPLVTRQTVFASAIMLGVVGVAALTSIPIVISALGGVVAMVVSGCLPPSKIYDAVSWNVIFLLAGVIPLGIAMRSTGGADLVAAILVQSATVVPPIVVLGLFYLLTSLLANLITPVASVVLMIPIAVNTATRIDAYALAFVFAVTFGAANAFMTPIGYQTNLMVYGPGGYKFSDYLRVGAPLQLLLTVVVTVGIAVIWHV
jgi:di/tricarboxylate transporter